MHDKPTTPRLLAQWGICRGHFVSLPHEAGGEPPRAIIIAACREDEEPWRLARLRRVALAALGQGLEVDALHDRKGCLSVCFRRRPTPTEIIQVVQLWHDENEPVVDAVFYGRDLVLGKDPSWPW
jgi:hypothetical protein